MSNVVENSENTQEKTTATTFGLSPNNFKGDGGGGLLQCLLNIESVRMDLVKYLDDLKKFDKKAAVGELKSNLRKMEKASKQVRQILSDTR